MRKTLVNCPDCSDEGYNIAADVLDTQFGLYQCPHCGLMFDELDAVDAKPRPTKPRKNNPYDDWDD